MSRRAWITAFAYAAGILLAGWAIHDLSGWIAAKAYSAAVLAAAGGLRPLGMVAWYGLAKCPPSAWFTDKREDGDGV